LITLDDTGDQKDEETLISRNTLVPIAATRETVIGASMLESEQTETLIPTISKITYHKLYEFGKLFERNKLGLGLLENSFSPDLNQK